MACWDSMELERPAPLWSLGAPDAAGGLASQINKIIPTRTRRGQSSRKRLFECFRRVDGGFGACGDKLVSRGPGLDLSKGDRNMCLPGAGAGKTERQVCELTCSREELPCPVPFPCRSGRRLS